MLTGPCGRSALQIKDSPGSVLRSEFDRHLRRLLGDGLYERNDDRLIKTDDPYPDRKPDGRLEHVPLDILWDQFATFIDYHLQCQLRDCYISRGEAPPAQYRVHGLGTDHMMVRCMTRDCLPPYHQYDADIAGYRAEDTLNAGLFAPLVELFG